MILVQPELLAIGFGVGVLLGLTGFGGAVFMAPILVLSGIQPIIAVGTTTAMMAVTKFFGAGRHVLRGTADFRASGLMAAGSIPGALGLMMRRFLYPRLLGGVGRNVVFGANLTLRHPHKIFIGDNVVIDDNCLLDAKGEQNDGIRIGHGVFIGRNSILHCKNGDIVIGDQCNIGFNCDIASSNRVEIGPRTLMAAYAYVVGGGHDYAKADVPIMEQQRVAKGIRIGAGCWIGAGVTVLDGVTVGEETIIGTGAVCTADLSARSIAVGMPARVVRKREKADDEALRASGEAE